ncbi:MAG TPA: AraC family transcriptional regulator [Kofleriaceae bacterium]|nr:AraC family transcriptional regulator [Kofleriaceae bacterium]
MAPPSECRWDTEILGHAFREWPGFTIHAVARRACGPGEFTLRSSSHMLSLPLAGAEPYLEGRLEAAHTSFAMRPGHAFLRPAHSWFRGWSQGVGTFRYCMLSFEPEMIARATGGEVSANVDMAPSMDIGHPALVRGMTALASQVERPGPGGRLYRESLATAVLLELVRHCALGDRVLRAALGRTGRELGRFADYVEANLAEDLSLFTLAAHVGLSPSHLTRELRRVSGLAPHQYVLRRRAERARVLLDRGEHSLSAVALAVGFSSQAHLNMVFRKVFGITPGAYRTLNH